MLKAERSVLNECRGRMAFLPDCRDNACLVYDSRKLNNKDKEPPEFDDAVRIFERVKEKYIFDHGSIPELKLNRSELRDEIRRLVN